MSIEMTLLPLAVFSQYILGVLLFIISTFLVLLILIQQGRGGGLTGALGGPGGTSAFGAKSGDVFTWITIVTAAIWIVLAGFTTWFFNEPEAGSALPQTPTTAVSTQAQPPLGEGMGGIGGLEGLGGFGGAAPSAAGAPGLAPPPPTPLAGENAVTAPAGESPATPKVVTEIEVDDAVQPAENPADVDNAADAETPAEPAAEASESDAADAESAENADPLQAVTEQ